MTVIIVLFLFLVMICYSCTWLAPAPQAFQLLAGQAFQILVPTKNTIVVVFVWVGLNSDKVRLMKSSASELGLKDKI